MDQKAHEPMWSSLILVLPSIFIKKYIDLVIALFFIMFAGP